MEHSLSVQLIEEAYERLKEIVVRTPLQYNKRLSEKYKAQIYLKREDLQLVRSYKLRGAYNRIALLSPEEKNNGVVCASTGNHAQGVACSCALLQVKGHIYMPRNTPKQKVERVKSLGGEWISIELVGDTFDEASQYAKDYCTATQKTFVHPFDDFHVMAGQGTVGLEILQQLETKLDYIIVPIGGGGLVGGVSTYTQSKDPHIQVIGVESEGAPSMTKSLQARKITTLTTMDTFVDGAAVKTVGNHTFEVAKNLLKRVVLVSDGRVCEEMISLYQSDGIIAEPAGTLSVASLLDLQIEIEGKTVVCVISGGNNDISRYPEIVDRSLMHKGLKHYFIIEFSQRPGALREYLDHALGKNDDITLFEYIKKSNKETGPALVGVELADKTDLNPLLERMNSIGLTYEILKRDSPLFRLLV